MNSSSNESLIKQVMQSPLFLTYSILVHVVFVSVFLLSSDWNSKPKSMPHVIQATVIDESKIRAEVEKLRLADEKKKTLEAAQQKKLDDAQKARKREDRELAELKKKRDAERRKQQREEKKRKVEEKKQHDAKQKQIAEEKRVAKEKRIKQQKQDQLKKLKVEEARLEKQMKREEEARIKQAEARKRQQEEARIRQQQLAEEQRRLDAAREREYRSIVAKHVEIIRQKVNRNWLRPAGSTTGLACTVKVRIIPGGDVLDVRITRSSGNAVFDRSVERAVLKASPLPLPTDRALFDRFRELEFIFDPEG